MGAEIELLGLDDLLSAMELMGVKMSDGIGPALEYGAEPVLNDMQNTTVFKDRTGKLRKSLKISSIKTKRSQKFVWVGDIDREAPYSWDVEFGTSKMEARPFMGPAMEKRKSETSERIRQKLTEALK
jgi:HK97 gp10 family phage protein